MGEKTNEFQEPMAAHETDNRHEDTIPEKTSNGLALEAAPMQPTKLNSIGFILTMTALALAVFCVALDNVIIVTAIPRITDDFHSVNDIGW